MKTDSVASSPHALRRIARGSLKAAALPLTVAALLGANQAVAQEPEEILVTARFRAENLQEIPLAISAISAESLEDNGAMSVIDVADWAPNVVIDQLGSSCCSSEPRVALITPPPMRTTS